MRNPVGMIPKRKQALKDVIQIDKNEWFNVDSLGGGTMELNINMGRENREADHRIDATRMGMTVEWYEALPQTTSLYVSNRALSDEEIRGRAASFNFDESYTRVVTGQIQIVADDGDMQIEPFRINGPGHVKFMNNNTFFVNRKPGAIIDMTVPVGSGMTSLKLFVNGRDTGIQRLIASMMPTINSRMPYRIPVMAGAAVQLVVVK